MRRRSVAGVRRIQEVSGELMPSGAGLRAAEAVPAHPIREVRRLCGATAWRGVPQRPEEAQE